MIKVYDNVLDQDLIKSTLKYFENVLSKEVWTSSLNWQDGLTSKSSNVITHTIRDENICKKIKKSVEKKINIDFDDENLNFLPIIYVWSANSYITWHEDSPYPYNGTIYLNQNWNSNDGGIFLYKDNKTNIITGIEPTFNTMIVNSNQKNDPHTKHCVTSISSNIFESRVTIQWRTKPFNSKNKKRILYQ